MTYAIGSKVFTGRVLDSNSNRPAFDRKTGYLEEGTVEEVGYCDRRRTIPGVYIRITNGAFAGYKNWIELEKVSPFKFR